MALVGEWLEFELTADHVTLLSNGNVRWGEIETGAPEIDGKRPYGNSDVYRDVADILGWVDDWDDVSPNQERELRERAEKLHRETEVALQICLAALTWEPGTYRTSSRYGSDWKRVEE